MITNEELFTSFWPKSLKSSIRRSCFAPQVTWTTRRIFFPWSSKRHAASNPACLLDLRIFHWFDCQGPKDWESPSYFSAWSTFHSTTLSDRLSTFNSFECFAVEKSFVEFKHPAKMTTISVLCRQMIRVYYACVPKLQYRLLHSKFSALNFLRYTSKRCDKATKRCDKATAMCEIGSGK